ncbi:hypothetical protein V3C99_017426 [Haemonchus contortus]|uniref:PHD domain-containing protein n=1 Tax=Haemonchus contortus TaxID=6289 RepID=A0A7I4Z653_HAECO
MPEANKTANSKKTKPPTPHAVSRELDERTAKIEEMMENCKISLDGLIERDDKTRKENEFGKIKNLNERTMKERLNMSADELKFCNELYGKLAKFYTGKEPNGEDEGQQGYLSDPNAPPVEDDANEGAGHTAVSTTVNLKKKDAKASSFSSFGKDKWLRTEGIKIAKDQLVAKPGKKARRSSRSSMKRKFSSPPVKSSSSSKKKSATGPGEVKSRKNSSENHSDKNECIHEAENSMDQGAEMSKENSHSDSSSDENESRFKCSKVALTHKKGQKRPKSSGKDIHGMERSEVQGTETSGEDNHSDSSSDVDENEPKFGSLRLSRTPMKEQERSENFAKVRRRLSYDSLDEMECEGQRSKTQENRKRRVRFADESPEENEDECSQRSANHRVGRAKIPRLTVRRPSSESPRRHDRRYCPQSPPNQEQLETAGRKRGINRDDSPDTPGHEHPLQSPLPGNLHSKVSEVANGKKISTKDSARGRFGSAEKTRVFHRDDSPDVRERGYALRSPSLGSGQKSPKGNSWEGTPGQHSRSYSSPLSPIRERSERVTRARALYREVTEDDSENFESKCRRLMLIQEEIRSLKQQMLSGDGQRETYVRVIEPTPTKKRLERAKLEFKSEWDKLLFDEKHKLNQYMKYDYSISEFVLEYPMTWQVRRFERPQNPRTRKADDEEMEVDLGSPPAKIPRTRAAAEGSKAIQKNIGALARAPEGVQQDIEALSKVPEAIQKNNEVTPVKRGNHGNGEVNRMEEPVPAQRDNSDRAAVVNAQTPRTLARVQPAIYEVNPNDEIYCYCRSGSNGRMIACDGEECKYGGWLHFRCSRLKKVPKGKWYCTGCRPHYNDTGAEHIIKIEPDDDEEYGAGPSTEPQDQGKGIQKQTATPSK